MKYSERPIADCDHNFADLTDLCGLCSAGFGFSALICRSLPVSDHFAFNFSHSRIKPLLDELPLYRFQTCTYLEFLNCLGAQWTLVRGLANKPQVIC